MGTASSAMRTKTASRSASEKTATVGRSSSRQARITRQAISPRLAIRIFFSRRLGTSVTGGAAARAKLRRRLHPVLGLYHDVDGAEVIAAPRLVAALLQVLHDVP